MSIVELKNDRGEIIMLSYNPRKRRRKVVNHEAEEIEAMLWMSLIPTVSGIYPLLAIILDYYVPFSRHPTLELCVDDPSHPVLAYPVSMNTAPRNWHCEHNILHRSAQAWLPDENYPGLWNLSPDPAGFIMCDLEPWRVINTRNILRKVRGYMNSPNMKWYF